jgi:GNAT superfamily N-acetyltransferase
MARTVPRSELDPSATNGTPTLRAMTTSAPRLAHEGDLEEIQRIEVDAGRLFLDVGLPTIAGDDPPSLETLRAHLAAGTLWVIGNDRDRPVAFACASVVDGEGHLDQVSVRPAFAGRALGRRLIEEVCDWARARGFHGVTLTTFRDVPFNGPLYERYGFTPVPDDEMGPDLVRIRDEERAHGIDVALRIAMRRPL